MIAVENVAGKEIRVSWSNLLTRKITENLVRELFQDDIARYNIMGDKLLLTFGANFQRSLIHNFTCEITKLLWHYVSCMLVQDGVQV